MHSDVDFPFSRTTATTTSGEQEVIGESKTPEAMHAPPRFTHQEDFTPEFEKKKAPRFTHQEDFTPEFEKKEAPENSEDDHTPHEDEQPASELCLQRKQQLEEKYTKTYLELSRLKAHYEEQMNSTACLESTMAKYEDDIQPYRDRAEHFSSLNNEQIKQLQDLKPRLNAALEAYRKLKLKVEELSERCKDTDETISDMNVMHDALQALTTCPGLSHADFKVPSWTEKWVYFEQHANMQTDTEQDHMMDRICKQESHKSRAAETGEIMERTILGIPVQNTAATFLLGTCPACKGEDDSSYKSGHARLCWKPGALLSLTGATGTCGKGKRAILCVIDDRYDPGRVKTLEEMPSTTSTTRTTTTSSTTSSTSTTTEQPLLSNAEEEFNTPICKKTKFKVIAANNTMHFILPAGSAEDFAEKTCGDHLDGKVSFVCDADAKRWTLSKAECHKKEEPSTICAKAIYRVEIRTAAPLTKHSIIFKLPAAHQTRETRQKHCGTDMNGNATFECDANAKQWRLVDSSCRKPGDDSGELVGEEEEDDVEVEPNVMCRKAFYKVKHGDGFMQYMLPSSTSGGETLKKNCSGNFTGHVIFQCSTTLGIWRFIDSDCKRATHKKEPFCKKAKYKVEIGDQEVQFVLPVAHHAKDSKEEDCGEGFHGKLTFECDAESQRWKLANATCRDSGPMCKPQNYNVDIAGQNLPFALPSGNSSGETVSWDCGGKLEGNVTFRCDGEEKQWKLCNAVCKKRGPVCQAVNHSSKILGQELHYSLPAGENDGSIRSEDCGDNLEGNVTFKCNGAEKQWKLFKSLCRHHSPICKAAKYHVQMGEQKFKLMLPVARKADEQIQKECGSGFNGSMTFKCDGLTKRWKLSHAACVEPEPVCKATKYRIGIAGEKLRFSLAGGEGEITEKCAPLEGTLTFKCDQETRRWKVSDVGCAPVAICKAAKYHVRIGNAHKLSILLPSAKTADKTIEKECGDGLEGKLTFQCSGDTKHWRLIDSGCAQKGSLLPDVGF